MNMAGLLWANLRQRKLNTALNTLLLGLGIATLVILLIFQQQLGEHQQRNTAGFDLVAGAKGSPLQLILSAIFQVDNPTGNIPLKDAVELAQNRAVAGSIPMALGDSYEGFRIVGTTYAYPRHYQASLRDGRLWEADYEVVVGATVARERKLKIGDPIFSAHGLGADGEIHQEEPLRVVGILNPLNAVPDRLVLCNIETVWDVHSAEKGHAGEDEDHHRDHGETSPIIPRAIGDYPDTTNWFENYPDPGNREITALLIRYSSPLAAAMLPRFINRRTNMQAASPAAQTARLFTQLQVGFSALQAFGWILMITAALSIFVALYNNLEDRRYDLAVMRSLGASRLWLFWHIVLEGVLLSSLGLVAGLLLGHLGVAVLAEAFSAKQQLTLNPWVWMGAENALILACLLMGALAALIPAIRAYRTDIALVLAEG